MCLSDRGVYKQLSDTWLMRKIIIETDPTFLSEFIHNRVFETVESIELKTILKLELEKGVKILIVNIHMKPGFTLNDLRKPEQLEILNVLRTDNNSFTCLIKIEYTQNYELVNQYNKFINQFEIFFEPPGFMSKTKLIFSFIGNNDTIKNVLAILKTFLNIKINSVENYSFTEFDLISCLTERQKEIINTAKINGYYEIPRKISTEELSQKLGITKSTTIEHLRKAENRILSALLGGSNDRSKILKN
ncbi:MAG: helix-turn-helix domain-containing protein [Candidatus Hodarchaeales archaeon]